MYTESLFCWRKSKKNLQNENKNNLVIASNLIRNGYATEEEGGKKRIHGGKRKKYLQNIPQMMFLPMRATTRSR